MMINEKTSEISFQELVDSKTQYNGSEVIVRGFVYETSEGVVVLANEPNLKSCCIGSLANLQRQIVLSGFKPPEKNNRVIAMQGKLYSEREFGYRMEDAAMYQEAALPMKTLRFLLIVAILAGVFILRNWRKFN